MISGGICKEGLGRIIFHSGNVNSFVYRQVLNFFKEVVVSFRIKYSSKMELRLNHQKALEKKLKNSLEVVLYKPGKMGQNLMIKLFQDGPQVYLIYRRLNWYGQ